MSESSVETRKNNLKVLWSLSDRWFRLLEFFLILGTFYYFEVKTDNIFVMIIYWISWCVLWNWFTELGELISEKVSVGRQFSKNKKILIWVLSMIPVMVMYIMITTAVNSMISTK